MKILGIDEVGRGSLAGPLVVGAVVLNDYIPGLKDSKQLTRKQRTKLSKTILDQAYYAGLGWVSNNEIDKIGLVKALILASSRSITKLNIQQIDQIIIDGTINFLPDHEVYNLIKADQLIPAVSAASIIAKVARDEYMIQLDSCFPEYNFKNNVGYGTYEHLQAINSIGPCKYHRLSFQPMKSLITN